MQPNEPRPDQAHPRAAQPPPPVGPPHPSMFHPFTPQPFTPPPSAAGVVYEMRPDSKSFWRGVGTRALILLPLIAWGVSNAVRNNGVGWAVVLYVGLVVVLLAGALIMFQTSRVVLTFTAVEKHRLLLPPRRFERSAIDHGVLAPQYASSLNRAAPLLVLINTSGRSLLKLTGQIFEPGALFTLAERIGMDHFDVMSGPVGPKDVARRHPKVVSLFERRPMLVVLLGTVILLVLIVVGVTIFDPVNE